MDGWLVERVHEALRDHPAVVDVLRVVTALGKPQALATSSIVVAALLLLRRHPRAAAFVLVAVLGSGAVNVGMKDVVGRARPVLADPVASASGASFPSGHAMTSAAAYGVLVVLAPASRRRPVLVIAAVLVLAIGLTRIALGVHWPTDVVGGWVFGLAWLAACAAVLRPRSTCDPSGPRR